MKEWYDVARRLYPDVLVHNNQYPNQWTRENLLTYIKLAAGFVDLRLVLFPYMDKDNYIGAKDMAGHLAEYRDLALADGKVTRKIIWRSGNIRKGMSTKEPITDRVAIAPVLLYDLDVWRKWLNWFRFCRDGYGGQTAPTDWSLLWNRGCPHPTKHMDWVNRCNRESHIGDYLVRLKTTDVRYVPGTTKYTEGKPGMISVLNPRLVLKRLRAGSCRSRRKVPICM